MRTAPIHKLPARGPAGTTRPRGSAEGKAQTAGRALLRRAAAAAVLLLAAVLPAGTALANAPTEIRIQLKWLHQFQFAGYYAATEQGYFEAAGLNVTLIEGGPAVIPTDAVLAGEAEFGVGTSGLLVSHSRGRPVVAVAAIHQHSPFILIARDDPSIVTPADLAGRTVMVEPYAEELIAFLHGQGVTLDAIDVIEHTADPLMLADGTFDGMTAYTTTEPFLLDNAGIAYRVFDPKVAGIDFYGDTLFTTAQFASANEATVVAVRDAVIRGWQYALSNPDEIIELIIERYAPRIGREHLRYEANEIRRLLVPDLIEIGYMNPDRWAHIARQFAAAGLIAEEVDLDAFLFSPAPLIGSSWWAYVSLLAAGLVTLLVTAALAKFYMLNRSLHAEVARRRELEHQLQDLVITDPGTGVLNRRGFMQLAHAAMERAEGSGERLALLVIDLDEFKSINDTHGHAAGDHVLNEFARICRSAVRDRDAVARLGGEEFAVLLPGSGEREAREVAERLRSSTEAHTIRLPRGDTLAVTVSVGMAAHQPGESLDTMISRADGAMYEAKAMGRNQVVVAAAFNQTARLRIRRNGAGGGNGD